MTFFVSVRAVNRSYRFVPTKQVRESLDYALKATAQKFEGRIALYEYQFLSNHYHLLGADLEGCLPDFMRELNALFSRQLNSLRGIRGSNIEKDYNLVIVDMVTGERAFEHAVYILANAVRANLVERTSQWLAPSSYALEYGEVVTAQQPKCGLWSDKVAHAERKASRRSKRARYVGKSKLPEVAQFKLVRPPIRPELSDAELRAAIRAEVTKIENELIAQRRRTGRRVMGWKRVVAMHYLDIPNEKEEYFGVRPTFSGDDEVARQKARARRKRFLADYYAARDRFFAGIRDVVFPFGTWLMKRIFKVNCATCRPALAT